jgi:hypothetical protein
VFVEGHFAIVIAHIDFEFARRAPPLPAVVRISYTEILLRCGIANTATRHKFHPEESEEQSAQMRKYGDASCRFEYGDDSDHHPDSDQILGFNSEREREHVHFLVCVEDSERHQQSENAARCAGRRSPWIHAEEVAITYRDRHQSSAHYAEGIALDESARPPVAFQICANEPEREHVEKNVAEVDVQQRVRDQLPHFAVHHSRRNQYELRLHLANEFWREPERDRLHQVDCRASDDDALHPSRKRREAERDGLSAGHFSNSSLIFQVPARLEDCDALPR